MMLKDHRIVATQVQDGKAQAVLSVDLAAKETTLLFGAAEAVKSREVHGR